MSASGRSTRSKDEMHSFFEQVEETTKPSIAHIDELLYPSNSLDAYYALQRQLANNGHESKQNAAARVIQKTFKMFQVRKVFRKIFDVFLVKKRNRVRAFFYVLLLNTNIKDEGFRNKAYLLMAHQFRVNHVFPPSYVSVSPRAFRITALAFIPDTMKERILVRFVQIISQNMMRSVLFEWKIAVRREKVKRAAYNPFTYEKARRIQYKQSFVSFMLWRGWTQKRKLKKITIKHGFPEWQNFMKTLKAKATKVKRADEMHLTFMKKHSLQALTMLMRRRNKDNADLFASDAFRLKQVMMQGYRAWISVIHKHIQRSVLLHNTISKWRKCICHESYLRKLYNFGKARHEFYLKRRAVSMLLLNIRAASVTRTYMFCKLQTKPATCLSLLYMFMNDYTHSLFSASFGYWSNYVRRRRMWHRFLFQNIKTSEYDVTKKKAFAALRKRPPPFITAQLMTSSLFAQETMLIYERVMKSKANDRQIYLLLNEKDAAIAQRNASTARNKHDAREFFFKAWRTTKPSLTLFMRMAIINAAKRKTNNPSLPLAERYKNTYYKACYFLEQSNFASSNGLATLKATIKENSKSAYSNRIRCDHRDSLILMAHENHQQAIQINQMMPRYTTSDPQVYFSKIKEVTDDVMEHYRPVKQLVTLAQTKGLHNDPSFSHIKCCKAIIPSIQKSVLLLHEAFQKKQQKLDATISLPSFNAFSNSVVTNNALTFAKSNLTADQFAGNKIDASQVRTMLANKRLLRAAPKKGRRARVIDHSTKSTFTMASFPEEEEEEDTFGKEQPLSTIGSIQNLSQNLNVSNMNLFKDRISSFSSSLNLSSNKSSFIGSSNAMMEGIIEESYEESGKTSSKTSPEKEYYSNEEDEENTLSHSGLSAFNLNQEESDLLQNSLDNIISGKISRHQSIGSMIPTPDITKKHHQFIEILFGDPNALKDPNLDKLRDELISKAQSTTKIKEVSTFNPQPYVMPIGNLITAYREEINSDEDLDDTASNPKTRAGTQSLTNVPKAELQNETRVLYGSKKYQMPPKKGRTRVVMGANGKLERIFEVLSSSSDDDMLFEEPIHTLALEEDENEDEEGSAANEEEDYYYYEEEEYGESDYEYEYYYCYYSDNEEKPAPEQSSSSKISPRAKISLGETKQKQESASTTTFSLQNSSDSKVKIPRTATFVLDPSHTGKPKQKRYRRRRRIGGHKEKEEESTDENKPDKSGEKKNAKKHHRIRTRVSTAASIEELSSESESLESTSHSKRSKHSHSRRSTAKSDHKDSKHSTSHSRRKKRSQPIQKAQPIKPEQINKMSWNPEALDKVVFKILEKSVAVNDVENLVEIDQEDPNQQTKETVARPKNNATGKRRPIYVSPQAPKQFERHVFDHQDKRHKNIPPKENKFEIIENKKELTQSMQNILNETRHINKLIYNQGKTEISSKSKKNQPLPPLPPSKAKSSFEYLPFDGNWTTVPEVIEEHNEQLNKNKPSKESHFQGTTVAPQSIEQLEMNVSLETKGLNNIFKRHKSSVSPPPIRKPIVIKRQPLYIAQKNQKSDFNSKALRRVVRQILEVISASQSGEEEINRLRRRVSMIRKKPAFIGLKQPEQHVNNQFYDKTQSILIRFASNQNARYASDELINIFSESLNYSAILIEEIERLFKEEHDLIRVQRISNPVDPKAIDPSFAVHLVDLDWMVNLKTPSGVEVMYKNEKNRMSAILAPQNISKNHQTHNRRKRKHKFVPISHQPMNDFGLDDLVIVSRYVPLSMVNQILKQYQKENEESPTQN